MRLLRSPLTFLAAGLLLSDVLRSGVVTCLVAAESDPAGVGPTVLAALIYSQLSLLLVWAVLSRRRWWTRALALITLYLVATLVLATPGIVLFATAGASAELNFLAGGSAKFNSFLKDAWGPSFLGLAVVMFIMRRRGLSSDIPDDGPDSGQPWQFSTFHMMLGLTYVAVFIAILQAIHRARLDTILSVVVYTSFGVFYMLMACAALWATLSPGCPRPRLLLFSAVPVLAGAFTAWMTALSIRAPITPHLLVPPAIFGAFYPFLMVAVLLLVRRLGYRLDHRGARGAAQPTERQSRYDLGRAAMLSRRRRLVFLLVGLVAVAAVGLGALALGRAWLGDSASKDVVTNAKSQPVQDSDERVQAWAHIKRGDGIFNQGKLPEALREYDKAIEIYTRLIEQEQRSELANYLAWALSNRGAALGQQGKLTEAVRDYDKAIDVYTRLIEQQGRSEFARNLAFVLRDRGSALGRQGKLPEAIQDLAKAIDIYTRLIEQEACSELADQLAWALNDRGAALAKPEQLPEAVRDYDRAIDIYTRLVEHEGRFEFAGNLALVLNNRGSAIGMQGELPKAIQDLTKAIDIYTRLVEREGHSELANHLASALNNRGSALTEQDKLPEAVQDLTKAIDIYTRLVEQEGRSHLANDLGRALKNRGRAMAKQDKLPEAIQDYEKAIDIRSRLVEQEGRSDLADELAQTLNSLAWLHATHPDAQFRDGAKAVRHATHACELTNWKDFRMLDTLAAAFAQKGDFEAAIKWETKAAEWAPEDQRAELERRLDLFQSRQPYRQP